MGCIIETTLLLLCSMFFITFLLLLVPTGNLHAVQTEGQIAHIVRVSREGRLFLRSEGRAGALLAGILGTACPCNEDGP